jgi:hypothetical protein
MFSLRHQPLFACIFKRLKSFNTGQFLPSYWMCEEMAVQDMGVVGRGGGPELEFSVRYSKGMSRRPNLVVFGLQALFGFLLGFLHCALKYNKKIPKTFY